MPHFISPPMGFWAHTSAAAAFSPRPGRNTPSRPRYCPAGNTRGLPAYLPKQIRQAARLCSRAFSRCEHTPRFFLSNSKLRFKPLQCRRLRALPKRPTHRSFFVVGQLQINHGIFERFAFARHDALRHIAKAFKPAFNSSFGFSLNSSFNFSLNFSAFFSASYALFKSFGSVMRTEFFHNLAHIRFLLVSDVVRIFAFKARRQSQRISHCQKADRTDCFSSSVNSK